jgi:hypothetical protein
MSFVGFVVLKSSDVLQAFPLQYFVLHSGL